MEAKILIVDDEPGVRSALGEILSDEGYALGSVGTAAEARAALQREGWDLLLLDLVLPDEDGLLFLEELRQSQPEIPVIVISGQGNVGSAVRATRLGAYDFLEKPLALSRVLLTVTHALERRRMARRIEQLAGRQRPDRLVGESSAMARLGEELARAAASESRILILGENGTGKELVARRLHRLSARASEAFVEVNCAAIPEDLIESELFGHRKGAFTGASADRAGRFEQADRGTLFLDEVADMSLKTQAKVLRVLEGQRFEPVGGGATIRVDVRVLAATNKDLEEEIRQQRFREDLYFRLAVIPLRLPALRERAEDIPLLVHHFLELLAKEQGRRPKSISAAALEHLRAYPWPGNVRELSNVVERMMIMAPEREIGALDLPARIRGEGDSSRLALAEGDLPLREARRLFEKGYIERHLEKTQGNVSRTAEALELERSHLHRKIKAYGIRVHRGIG